MHKLCPSSSALFPPPSPTVGELLRFFRARAGISQLELALSADISSRHLSYLETGKAHPSEATINRVTDALGLSEADNNALRIAAGFRSKATTPDPSVLAAPYIQETLESILGEFNYTPILIKDRNWNIVSQNALADDLFYAMIGQRLSDRKNIVNVLDLVFSKTLFRPLIQNWHDVASALVGRIRYEIGFSAESPEFLAMIDRLSEDETFREMWRNTWTSSQSPSITYELKNGQNDMMAFKAITTSLGAAHDAFFTGVRIYSFYPQNAAARRFLLRSMDT